MKLPRLLQGLITVLSVSAAVQATSPSLTLTPSDSCYTVGATITVTVDLADAPAAIVGGQFFLSYDTSRLNFISADPAATVFTREVYEFVDTGAGTIDHAVGIEDGGTGATAGTMAVLTFTALSEVCNAAALVSFRVHAPPGTIIDVDDVVYEQGKDLTVDDLPAISIDSTPPTVTPPTAQTVECDGAGNLAAFNAWKNAAAASDSCSGNSTPTYVEVSDEPGCAGTSVVTAHWTSTDDCGNAGTSADVTFTIVDTTAPTVTPAANQTVQCDGAGNLAAFNAWKSAATAFEACGAASTPAYVEVSNVPGCGGTGVVTAHWTSADDCGNTGTSVDATFTIIAVPTFNDSCPLAPILVNADAGGCTASAATVNAVAPGASEVCSGISSVVGTRSDSQPMDAPYPGGTTTITWTATNGCNTSAICTQDVTVSGFNEMLADVELSPTVAASLTRCITFELFDCNANQATEIMQPITFTNGLATNVSILVPCSLNSLPVSYTCITARDRLHTLRRTDADNFGVQPIEGTRYRALFTNRTGQGANNEALVGGNLNDDNFVDIIDFGAYVNRFGVNYGTGDTTCSTPRYHSDISGNGTVGTEDFTFIQINFLRASDANCCSLSNQPGGPLLSITRAELQRRGLGELVIADLNRDGMLDQWDVAAFISGVRPHRPVPAPIPLLPSGGSLSMGQ